MTLRYKKNIIIILYYCFHALNFNYKKILNRSTLWENGRETLKATYEPGDDYKHTIYLFAPYTYT